MAAAKSESNARDELWPGNISERGVYCENGQKRKYEQDGMYLLLLCV